MPASTHPVAAPLTPPVWPDGARTPAQELARTWVGRWVCARALQDNNPTQERHRAQVARGLFSVLILDRPCRDTSTPRVEAPSGRLRMFWDSVWHIGGATPAWSQMQFHPDDHAVLARWAARTPGVMRSWSAGNAMDDVMMFWASAVDWFAPNLVAAAFQSPAPAVLGRVWAGVSANVRPDEALCLVGPSDATAAVRLVAAFLDGLDERVAEWERSHGPNDIDPDLPTEIFRVSALLLSDCLVPCNPQWAFANGMLSDRLASWFRRTALAPNGPPARHHMGSLTPLVEVMDRLCAARENAQLTAVAHEPNTPMTRRM